MIDCAHELASRSAESGISEDLLKTVYLREIRDSQTGGADGQRSALARVDRFMLYALVRDTGCAQDRDLADFLAVG